MTSRSQKPETPPRKVTVLGATGSVGGNALNLLARSPGAYAIEALSAFSRVDDLVRAARTLKPAVAVIGDPALYGRLKEGLAGTGVEAAAGEAALIEAASRPVDWVLGAIVGAAGLRPTLAAARNARILALANKECLVCAGALFKRELAQSGTALVPVDSEHSAIFQVLDTRRRERIVRLILTASGGPFRDFTTAEMAGVTPEQAVSHPNWRMGAKISVDSATMMNKGLEVIEAHHLFEMPPERIDVVIHPQSVVHSLVEYCDGSLLAQMGSPDMRTPIAVALAWPDRMATPVTPLDLTKTAPLTFAPPDAERFPCLSLARGALRSGGAAPTLLNAANEAAVMAFLHGRIGFLRIAEVVERVLATVDAPTPADIDDVLAVDALGRRAAEREIA